MVGVIGAIVLQALLCRVPSEHALADCCHQGAGFPDGQEDSDDSGAEQQDETNDHPEPVHIAWHMSTWVRASHLGGKTARTVAISRKAITTHSLYAWDGRFEWAGRQ